MKISAVPAAASTALFSAALTGTALVLAAGPAMAHPGLEPGGLDAYTSLLAGAAHPLSGADHLLAMVAVGFAAVTLGGRAHWLLPMAFVSAMAVGGVLGFTGTGLPFVETILSLSLVVIGGLASVGQGFPAALAAGVVAMFAVFHGQAHGAEMPEAAAGFAYGLGFITATVALHGAGVIAGLRFRQHAPMLARWAGAAIAAAGVAMLANAV